MIFQARPISWRIVLFVYGCFWPRHPDPAGNLARLPKAKHDFWVPKLERNRKRGEDNEQQLHALGWDMLAIWECQPPRPEELRMRIREFLGP